MNINVLKYDKYINCGKNFNKNKIYFRISKLLIFFSDLFIFDFGFCN